MHSIKLLTLNCHVSDEDSLDEVYLMYKDDRIWPQNKKFKTVPHGETPLNISIEDPPKGESIEIELWDRDLISSNDKLGVFTLVLDQFGGGYVADMKKIKSKVASYELSWEYY